MNIRSAIFVLSATAPVHYPPGLLPEVAFAGRSNVGKSSLINRLLLRRGLARTSNTPGRTQEINFFSVNDAIGFVDLPGYGYAKVPEPVRRQWGPMVETYLRERRTLRLVVLLMDLRRDPSSEDLQLIEWLSFYGRPCRIVLTKADKLGRGQREARRRQVAEAIRAFPAGPMLLFSARTGEGRETLWREIREALAAPPSDVGP